MSFEAYTGNGGDGKITHLSYTGQGTTSGNTSGAIICSSIATTSGAVIETGIVVAMPWSIRPASYDDKEINGVTYTYIDNFEREADDGSDTWTEEVYMQYTSGDIISVISNDGVIPDISNDILIQYIEISNNRVWLKACS